MSDEAVKAKTGKKWNQWLRSLIKPVIYFLPKGDAKSQVVVQHSKLPDAKAAAKMKTYWRKALDKLGESLRG